MKLITVALVCLLLAGMWTQAVDSKSMHVSSSNCCYKFMNKSISLKNIQCYKNTSSTCPYDALILKLKKGRESCVLKTVKWVQDNFSKMKLCLPKRV
ncbi:C-C motif chemokine 1 [Loxodonta africana]|uniref:C-C motif chemokine 1 n=1 Tax=Loxodonta africana TaxID=9785 RepID=UPI0005405CC9|nr:C-C motif chemokine 1 [Loxodonta africana]XP_049717288.1 C-C motif chemokine 1 [Elephas maximus indicus]